MLHSLAPFPAGRVEATSRGARCSARRHIVLALEPTRRRLCIETDDDRVERYARTAYAPLLGAGTVGAALDYARFFTARVPATVCFNGRALPDGHAKDGTHAVDQFVWRSLAGDAEWMRLYGCAFTLDGRAVLLAGPSGVGKTTLALALAAAGASVIGDEMTLIHRQSRHVTALRRALTIRSGTLGVLDDERISAVAERFGKPIGDETLGVVALDPSRLAPIAERAPLAAVVVAEHGDGLPRLTRISTERAAARLAPFLTEHPMDLTAVAEVAELISSASAYRLTIGTPRDTAALLLDGVRSC
jgi:hypothetical protein